MHQLHKTPFVQLALPSLQPPPSAI